MAHRTADDSRTLRGLCSGGNIRRCRRRHGDFQTLTEAAAASSTGDTILLRAGVYGEQETFPIALDHAVTIESEDGAVLDSPRFKTMLSVTADGVTLRNIRFQVRKWGIVADVSREMTVEDCEFVLGDEECRTSSTAIWLRGMKECAIRRCTFRQVGICIAGDPLSDKSAGKTVLTGMCEAGEDPEYFSTHEIADCTINGRPYYYFVGQDNLTVPTDAGGLIAVECDNLTVRDIDVSDSSMGLEIARSRNVTLENVSADRCGIFGTYLVFVQDAVLRNVHVEQTNHGIDIRGSQNVVVTDSLALNCDQGVFFTHCTDCTLQDSHVQGCGFGYFGAVGNGNRVENCTFSDNADGIYLQNEPNATITACDVRQSRVTGLRILKSSWRLHRYDGGGRLDRRHLLRFARHDHRELRFFGQRQREHVPWQWARRDDSELPLLRRNEGTSGSRRDADGHARDAVYLYGQSGGYAQSSFPHPADFYRLRMEYTGCFLDRKGMERQHGWRRAESQLRHRADWAGSAAHGFRSL